MSRRTLALAMSGLCLLVAQGCAQSLELATIEDFTSALEQGDFEALKADSSVAFQQKALRREEAVDDLELLRLPRGEVSILDIEDVSPDEKLVTVTAGKSNRKLRYKLVRGPEDERWMVDDIVVRQTREGLNVAKSVTEQMDLLLSLREFLDAWTEGARDEALAVTTPEFRDVLSDLPPGYLAQLTARVADGAAPAGDDEAKSAFRPEVQMDAGVAIATLTRPAGKLVVSCRLDEDGWKVNDLAVESKTDGRHIPSVAKTATVVHTTAEFLQAYARNDKPALQQVASRQFFNASLAPADLSMVPLPAELAALGEYEVQLQGQRAEFLIRGETEVTQIGLVREQNDADPTTPTRFLVDEVTIYELDGRQEKRLAAMFTAHATMRIFSEALSRGDLSMIRKTASTDFNKRVWRQVDPQLMSRMPLDEVEHANPRVLSTVFEGAVTEITVMQGSRALTYLLRDEGGHLAVDDVHVPVVNRPTSLKTTLELLIPVRDFIAAIDSQDVERLQRTSSDDLNRLVWRQTDTIPRSGYVVPRHLEEKLSAVKLGEEEALLVLGDARRGAHVRLVREYGRYVVDDVLLIAGPEATQRAEMKRTMRLELAERGLQLPETRFAAGPASPAGHGPGTSGRLGNVEETIPPPNVAPLEETFGAVRVDPGNFETSSDRKPADAAAVGPSAN